MNHRSNDRSGRNGEDSALEPPAEERARRSPREERRDDFVQQCITKNR